MLPYIAILSKTYRVGLAVWLLFAFGCTPISSNRETTKKNETYPLKSSGVSAQGRLLPASGIVQISTLPGDRIEEILVSVGQQVSEGQVLARMRSEKLRAAELSTARARLIETRKAAEAKKAEGLMSVETARNRLKQAESLRSQTAEQKSLIDDQASDSPTSQRVALKKQLDMLVALRNDPLTRPMIGEMELDARRIELSKVEMSLRSSKLTAAQANEAAELAIEIAREGIAYAEKAVHLVKESFPTESLERQIELLELQVAQSPILAPSSGTILSLLSEGGEMSSGLPIMELANLEKMSCIAEVHEADVSQLAIGDLATIRSSALEHPLQGRIIRIDFLIGMPQMRSANPMARTDFRAVPIVIELDDEESLVAAHRVQLQVDVLIQTARRAD